MNRLLLLLIPWLMAYTSISGTDTRGQLELGSFALSGEFDSISLFTKGFWDLRAYTNQFDVQHYYLILRTPKEEQREGYFAAGYSKLTNALLNPFVRAGLFGSTIHYINSREMRIGGFRLDARVFQIEGAYEHDVEHLDVPPHEKQYQNNFGLYASFRQMTQWERFMTGFYVKYLWAQNERVVIEPSIALLLKKHLSLKMAVLYRKEKEYQAMTTMTLLWSL